MPRKYLHTVTLMLCVSLTIVFSLGAAGEAAAKTTIKAISAWGKNHSGVSKDYLPYIKRANEMLQAKYPGEVEIQYIGGPEVIPIPDQPEALRKGQVDMYYGTAAYYAGVAPAANTTKLSQLTSQEEKDVGADAIYDEIHRKLLNAAYLGALGSQNPFQLYTIKKITAPDQINGLRIRTSAMYIVFKSTGCQSRCHQTG